MGDFSHLYRPPRLGALPASPSPTNRAVGAFRAIQGDEQPEQPDTVGQAILGDLGTIAQAPVALTALTVQHAMKSAGALARSGGAYLTGDKERAGEILKERFVDEVGGGAIELGRSMLNDYRKSLSFGFTEESRQHWKQDPLFALMDVTDALSLIGSLGTSAPVSAARKTALTAALRAGRKAGIADDAIEQAIKHGSIASEIGRVVRGRDASRLHDIVRASVEATSKLPTPESAGAVSAASNVVADAVVNQALAGRSAVPVWARAANAAATPFSTTADWWARPDNAVAGFFVGDRKKAAVSRLFSTEAVRANPSVAFGMEKWAAAQLAEQGRKNTPSNRLSVMRDWLARNTDYATLNDAEKLSHFERYMEVGKAEARINSALKVAEIKRTLHADVVDNFSKFSVDQQERLALAETRDEVADLYLGWLRNGEITPSKELFDKIQEINKTPQAVAARKLPQSVVDAAKDTVARNIADTVEVSASDIVSLINQVSPAVLKLADTVGVDIKKVVEAAAPLGAEKVIEEVRKSLDKLSGRPNEIRFDKLQFLNENTEKLARSLWDSEYYIANAPKRKQVSYVADVLKKDVDGVNIEDLYRTDSLVSRVLEKLGLSPRGEAHRVSQFYTQVGFDERFLRKHGGSVISLTSPDNIFKLSLPAERVYDFLDENLSVINRPPGTNILRRLFAPKARSVFDLSLEDLRKIGFSDSVARDVMESVAGAHRAIPASAVGAMEKMWNYLVKRTNPVSRIVNGALMQAYNIKFNSPLALEYSLQLVAESRMWQMLNSGSISMVPGSSLLKHVGFLNKANKLLSHDKRIAKLFAPANPREIEAVATLMRDELEAVSDSIDHKLTRDMSVPVIDISEKPLTASRLSTAERAGKSQNFWLNAVGITTNKEMARMAKAIAEKRGLSLSDALARVKDKDGNISYKHPELANEIREKVANVFTYKEGFQTSALSKTLNDLFFPSRFTVKTMQMFGEWIGSLHPTHRLMVTNALVETSNWLETDEGKRWAETTKNPIYVWMNYVTAFGLASKSLDALADLNVLDRSTYKSLVDGRLGKIGGMKLGVFYDMLRSMGFTPDSEEVSRLTGKEFTRNIPTTARARFAEATESILANFLPGSMFHELSLGLTPELAKQLKWRNLAKEASQLIFTAAPATGEYFDRDFNVPFSELLKREGRRLDREYRKK